MSNTPNENSGSEGAAQAGNNHPAYQSILDVLPESLHSVVLPTLKEWDAGVTRKFQEIHSSYEDLKPYKKLAEHGIDADYAEQSIILADQLQRDPSAVVEQINSSWQLGYTKAGQAPVGQEHGQPANNSSGTDELEYENLGIDLDDSNDILKHPKVKAMYDAVQKMQSDLESKTSKEEEDRQIAEFEEYLDELETKTTEAGLPFNRLFVTALMHSDIDGEEAVKQYHQVLAGNTQINTEQVSNSEAPSTPQAPVVMGGEGTGGAGTPDGSVNFGSLKKDDINKTVEQILAAAQDSG